MIIANVFQLHKSLSSGGFSVGIFQRKESNTYRLVGSAGGRSRVRSGQTSKRSSLIQQVGEVSFGCIGTVVKNLVAAWGHEQGIFDHLTMITRYLTISPVQGHVSRSGVLGSAGYQSSFDRNFLVFIYTDIIFLRFQGYAFTLPPRRGRGD